MSESGKNDDAPRSVDALASLRERGMRTDGFAEGHAARDALVRIGKMIRDMRTDAGLTQGALAERAGMSQTEISRLENGLGRHGPSVETLNRLAGALKFRLVMGVQPIEASLVGQKSETESDDARMVREPVLAYRAVL